MTHLVQMGNLDQNWAKFTQPCIPLSVLLFSECYLNLPKNSPCEAIGYLDPN